MENKIKIQISIRDQFRLQWNEVKDEKLSRKSGLIKDGLSASEVRHDKIYRSIRKKQRFLSKMIRHAEIKINRYLNGPGGRDAG